MSRRSIADRTRLSLFVVRAARRKIRGRLAANPLLRVNLRRAASDRLLIAPQDLRTADPTRASEIYAGHFAFAGKTVTCDGRSPFEMDMPSEEWAEALFGFGWLRHLRAADSAITRSNARALVDEWIGLQAGSQAIAWRPEVVARRIISWLTHAPLLLQDADVRFYRRFLRSLTRQVRYLRSAQAVAGDGLPRLQSIMALTYAGLCMASQGRLATSMSKRLAGELDRQVLPDGGHISRNPGAMIEILLDLLPLRQAFTARNLQPPPGVLNAFDRMMPMLRFFRHGDGSFAHFHGMGPTQPDLMATVLAYDDARGTPVANASHSGYQRLQAAGTVAIVDTGPPPPLTLSLEAHASCLAFELSSDRHRIVINCGMPASNRDAWRQAARATAAHSTVTFNDASSCRFLAFTSLEPLIGVPIIDGPSQVRVVREDTDAPLVRAGHDGYASRFGITHERALQLAADGRRLDGEDRFRPARGKRLPRQSADRFAVRFHLHPKVRPSLADDGRGVLLLLPNGETWTFSAEEDEVAIEESIYLAGHDRPRPTEQIVIYGSARERPEVRWSFAQAGAAPDRPGSRGSGSP
jgi:uncharacterized heparinase superfamily protein